MWRRQSLRQAASCRRAAAHTIEFVACQAAGRPPPLPEKVWNGVSVPRRGILAVYLTEMLTFSCGLIVVRSTFYEHICKRRLNALLASPYYM